MIKLAVRLVVFTGVFWIAAHKNPKVIFDKKWATPLVAFVFAVLNTALYWGLRPVLDLATFGAVAFAMPLLINTLLLAMTVRIFQSRKWFRIEGMFATMWMATFLTLAHGALWIALDYVPSRL
ncbi:MAG: hypothetical protein JWO36_988 [Myxococcales bacterium]|nr:hypothetical protein [Myxococcales bacterium]